MFAVLNEFSKRYYLVTFDFEDLKSIYMGFDS